MVVGHSANGPYFSAAAWTALGFDFVDSCEEDTPWRTVAFCLWDDVFDRKNHLNFWRWLRYHVASECGRRGKHAGITQLVLSRRWNEPRHSSEKSEGFEND